MKSVLMVFIAFFASIAAPGQWTAGMDDDAGKAAATSSADLPAADFTGMRHIMKGAFTIYAAELDAPMPDVVPDLTYTQHYGF